MSDIYMDVDAALAEVPVNLLALIDDTDFKTREVGIVYNQAGMDLVWNFVTTAGAMTQTAVTPTTAGNYDWAHQGDGIYSIEIPASGGASINNDTEGFGWFTGYCTGVLPWRGPVIGFRAAALNNALIDGGDNLDVNTVQWLGTACAAPTVAGVPEVDLTHMAGGTQTVTDLKDFADAGYDPATHKVQGVVLTDTTTVATTATNLTNAPTNGDLTAAMKTSVNAEADTALSDYDPPTKTEIDTAFTEIKGATWASGTDTLEHIRNKQTDIETDTAEIGAAGAGLTNINLPNQTMDIVGNITGNLSGSVGSLTGHTNQTADHTAAIADIPTTAEFNARTLASADYVVTTDTIAGVTTATNLTNAPTSGDLTATMKTSVNTEVLDVLNTDTFAEPGQGVPPATATFVQKVGYLYKLMRNKLTQTSTELKVYDDAGTTVDQKATISDDLTTYTRGEIGTGP